MNRIRFNTLLDAKNKMLANGDLLTSIIQNLSQPSPPSRPIVPTPAPSTAPIIPAPRPNTTPVSAVLEPKNNPKYSDLYLQTITSLKPKPQTNLSDAIKPDQKNGLLGTILNSIIGIGNYLNTPQGLKVLGGITQNPYMTLMGKEKEALAAQNESQYGKSLLDYLKEAAGDQAKFENQKEIEEIKAGQKKQASAPIIREMINPATKKSVWGVWDQSANSGKGDFVPTDAEVNKTEAEELLRSKKAENDLRVSEKEDQYLDKRFDLLNKQLDPSGLARGNFAVSKQVIDRADRLSALHETVRSFQAGNADSRQMEELAIGLNSMLSGSNVGSRSQVEALVPKTAIGDINKLKEWLLSNPKGLNQQAFVARMMQTIQNEKNAAERQIKKTRFQRLSGFSDLAKKDPDRFNDMLRSWEIDPDEYAAWKKGGFKKIDVSASNNDQNSNNLSGKKATLKFNKATGKLEPVK